jgi:hypothetical protein
MMEISDKVLTAAGLKPPVDDGVTDTAEAFTEADEAPIDLG